MAQKLEISPSSFSELRGQTVTNAGKTQGNQVWVKISGQLLLKNNVHTNVMGVEKGNKILDFLARYKI